MRSNRVLMTTAIGSLLLLVAAGSVAHVGTGAVHRGAAEPPPEVATAEVDRIRLHLGNVESALRARDTDGLSDDRRARRATALDWLREYRQRGVFPHNHTHPGERVPVFVDEHGTHCAVGYLLKRSGETELIEQVVAADNNVRVMELAGSERFGDWLEETGLTLAEAAWIQPKYGTRYGPDDCAGGCDADMAGLSKATVLGGIASGGLVLYSYLSEPGPRAFQVTGALNSAFSVFHLGVAAWTAGRGATVERDAGYREVALLLAMNGLLSAVSLHAGLSRFLRSRERRASPGAVVREEASREESIVHRHLQVSLPEPAWIHGRLGVRFRAVH